MTEPIPCPHSEVAFQPKNISFKNDALHYLEIFGYCTECKQRVVFMGAGLGVVKDKPSMTEDGYLIRLPFVVEVQNG